jgi:hypothetical protein
MHQACALAVWMGSFTCVCGRIGMLRMDFLLLFGKKSELIDES